MKGALPLRLYQDEAIEAVREAWNRDVLRPAVVLFTGAGKTVLFSHLAAAEPGRTLILVHRDELVRQTVDKILSVDPDLDVGVVKAAEDQADAKIIVGSVQTLARPERRERIGSVDLVVADECHHAVAPSWMEVLEHFGAFEGTRTVGFTATMMRADERGLGDVWQEVCFKRDVLWGIRHGFLCDVRAESVTVDDLDLAQVARNRGDFADTSLGEALEASGAGTVIAKAFLEHASERQGIMFCPTVSCSRTFAEDFNNAGIAAEVVVGETPLDERARIYERYRSGKTRVISSVMALTEGFDMPQAGVAIVARPTDNTGLFIQMVGRVLRLFPGKDRALVLDVVGATRNVSLVSIENLSETKVTIKDNESYAEAVIREEAERANVDRDVVRGTVTSAVAELFASSKAAWLQTRGGKWFIPAGKRMVLLWPSGEGLFRVGHCSTTSAKDGIWDRDGLTLGYAMAWGEALAIELDSTVAQRSSSWRRKKQKPSEVQVDYARRLKIDAAGMTKNQLSDAISIELASRILDR